MNRTSAPLALFMTAGIFSLACGGSGGGPTSPTTVSVPGVTSTQPPAATPPSSNQWTVFGGLELQSATLFQGLASGVTNPTNLLVAECIVDDTLRNRLTFDPTSRLPAGVSCAAPLAMLSGTHTMVIRVVSQTRSPATYAISGNVIANRGTATSSFGCPGGNRSLRTGEDVSCSFTLP